MTDDDYLLFPFVKERKSLKHKTGKLFVRFSKDLNLYHHKGGTRPLYSIRHTYATEEYKKGTSIEDIAVLMNTSPRMVLSVYLSHTDESLVQLANKNGKFKVVKWWMCLLNSFWIRFVKWWMMMNVFLISK